MSDNLSQYLVLMLWVSIVAGLISVIALVIGFTQPLRTNITSSISSMNDSNVFSINSVDTKLPIAGIIEYLTRNENSLKYVRTVEELVINSSGQLVITDKLTLDNSGFFISTPLCFVCEIHTIETSSCRIMLLDNSYPSLTFNMSSHIGKTAYLRISYNEHGEVIAYISLTLRRII